MKLKNSTQINPSLIKPKAQIDSSLIKSNKRWITRVLMSLILQENTQTTISENYHPMTDTPSYKPHYMNIIKSSKLYMCLI